MCLKRITWAYSIPVFSPGTVDAVMLDITQIEQNLPYSIRLRAGDMRGNTTECIYPDNLPVLKSAEFDTVGDDSAYFFLDRSQGRITENLLDDSGRRINNYSDFTDELFFSDAGMAMADPCFSGGGTTYQSIFTSPWTEAVYRWQIVLQMKPSSDIGLQITSCILEEAETDPWNYGRPNGCIPASLVPRDDPCHARCASPDFGAGIPRAQCRPGVSSTGIYAGRKAHSRSWIESGSGGAAISQLPAEFTPLPCTARQRYRQHVGRAGLGIEFR